MLNFLVRAKKFLLYGFAIVGVLALLWFVFAFGLNFARRAVYIPSFYEGGAVGAPLTGTQDLRGPSFDFFGSASKQNVAPPAAGNKSGGEGPLTQRKVVKNGSLSLLVKKAEEVAASIQAVAERLGGFVQDSQVYEVSAGVKSGTVTIRVSADKFNEAVSEIKKLAVKVERENISAQDVTEQFVDLEAQLKNYRAEEQQYLRIMEQALTVQDTLDVAQRLAYVRGNIERTQGQLQYLSRQVDMSTITTMLTAEADIEVFGIRWRPLFVVKQAFRGLLSGLTGYVDAMIAFVFRLPVYLLWIATLAVIIFLAWKVTMWIKRKFFSKHFPETP